jgi:large subunit ribosomal protein L1
LIAEIVQTQQLDFDKVLATPAMAQSLAKIARLLGPRGLMPSKKLGTLTQDLTDAVKRAKAGSVELRADRAGTIHCGFGKLSMTPDMLLENLRAILLCIENNKPQGVKGKRWVKSAYLKSTMSHSYPVELAYLEPKNPKFMAKD